MLRYELENMLPSIEFSGEQKENLENTIKKCKKILEVPSYDDKQKYSDCINEIFKDAESVLSTPPEHLLNMKDIFYASILMKKFCYYYNDEKLNFLIPFNDCSGEVTNTGLPFEKPYESISYKCANDYFKSDAIFFLLLHLKYNQNEFSSVELLNAGIKSKGKQDKYERKIKRNMRQGRLLVLKEYVHYAPCSYERKILKRHTFKCITKLRTNEKRFKSINERHSNGFIFPLNLFNMRERGRYTACLRLPTVSSVFQNNVFAAFEKSPWQYSRKKSRGDNFERYSGYNTLDFVKATTYRETSDTDYFLLELTSCFAFANTLSDFVFRLPNNRLKPFFVYSSCQKIPYLPNILGRIKLFENLNNYYLSMSSSSLAIDVITALSYFDNYNNFNTYYNYFLQAFVASFEDVIRKGKDSLYYKDLVSALQNDKTYKSDLKMLKQHISTFDRACPGENIKEKTVESQQLALIYHNMIKSIQGLPPYQYKYRRKTPVNDTIPYYSDFYKFVNESKDVCFTGPQPSTEGEDDDSMFDVKIMRGSRDSDTCDICDNEKKHIFSLYDELK